MSEVPEEVFDISEIRGATAQWPKARQAPPDKEADHPAEIPDRTPGPFGYEDEEIGYEGQR